MAEITIFPFNILSLGTTTVTGTAATGYPESRLYDDSLAFYWRLLSTTAVEFKVDQGAASILDIDFLGIGPHNFSGEDMQWQYSDNDADWTDAVTDWTQGDNLQITKEAVAATTHRYWKTTLTSIENPLCSEMFMGLGYTYDVLESPAPFADEVPNVQWNKSIGGSERSTKFGDARRVRNYQMFLDAADLVTFRAAMVYLDEYSKTFWIKDHEGVYFQCRMIEAPTEDFDNKTNTHISFNVIETL